MDFTSLIQTGTAGIVIVVVIIFVNYIKERDKAMQGSLDKLSTAIDNFGNKTSASIEALKKEQADLRVDIKGHHESVAQMVKTVTDATKNCDRNRREQKSW
jgi:methyl-accepting chemotaxis protein